MANTTLRFKDMTFEKVENYDPENTAADKNGIVSYWAAKTPDGEQVVTGENKKKCISAARAYVHEVNEATETAEASEVVEEQAAEQQVTEQPERRKLFPKRKRKKLPKWKPARRQRKNLLKNRRSICGLWDISQRKSSRQS